MKCIDAIAHILVMTSIAAILVLLCVAAFGADTPATSTAEVSMPDCFEATCRVTASDGDRGTGCVFEISNGRVYVMTNAHVATSIRMELEFWSDGFKSRKIIGSTMLRAVSRDIAVIAIDASAFGRSLPNVIPIAPMDTKLYPGQVITSVGCAGGAWATAWEGHVRRPDGIGGMIAFSPTPALGRSGSAIFDADGKMIVALLRAQAIDGRKEPVYGLAVNIREIWAALYGAEYSTGIHVEDREVFWPPAVQVQCGPDGCPPSQGSGGYVLPYRQRQEQINRRQDKQIGDLYPGKPFKAPGAEVEPPADENLDQPPPQETAVKEQHPLTVLSFLAVAGVLLICIGVGCAVGIGKEWRKSSK